MNARAWLIVGIVALLVLGGGGAAVYVMTRGLRNNNPLNIRENPNDPTRWVGERATDDDPVFEEFETMEEGIRAATIILRTYRTRYQLKTLRQIIERWAPPSENDTEGYIAAVSRWSGIGPLQEVREQDFPALIAAMTRMENGINPLSMATIEKGVRLA